MYELRITYSCQYKISYGNICFLYIICFSYTVYGNFKLCEIEFIYELKISYVVYLSHNGNYIYELKMSYVICFSYVEISYMKLCEMEISYLN